MTPSRPSGGRVLRGSFLALLALAAVLSAAAESAYWKSDQAGFPIEALAGPPVSPADDYWWLEVDKSDDKETRRLFRGEDERQRIVTGPASTPGHRLESTWHGKAKVDEIEYGADGEVLRESEWSESSQDKPLWTENYEYKNGRLDKVTRLDSAGAEIGGRDYRYDPLGRLLAVDLTGYFGSTDVGTVAGSGLPEALWSDREDGTMRIELFDGTRNVSKVRIVKGDKTLMEQSFAYDEKGSLVSDSVDDAVAGTNRLSIYGADGRVSKTTVTKDGAIVESHDYLWDSSGNLVEDTRSLPTPVLKIDRSYDSKGKLVKEERREDGVLVLVTSWESDSVRIEETWSGGQVVVRTRFENGMKVREDFLQDGTIVRSRVYP